MRVNMEVVSPVPTQQRGSDRRSPGHLRLLDPVLERRHLNRVSFHPFFSDRRIPITIQSLEQAPPITSHKASGFRWALWAMLAVLVAMTLRLAYRRDTLLTPVVVATSHSAPSDPGVTEYQWFGYHRLAA